MALLWPLPLGLLLLLLGLAALRLAHRDAEWRPLAAVLLGLGGLGVLVGLGLLAVLLLWLPSLA
ncbi:hypothetical protein [Deinococcus aluminii]|uniref:Uncharacterized protein n=1 Tax=Deinococcus aluminii TaxID=1656885 RepID=A0ABP9XCX9_9DEIO